MDARTGSGMGVDARTGTGMGVGTRTGTGMGVDARTGTGMGVYARTGSGVDVGVGFGITGGVADGTMGVVVSRGTGGVDGGAVAASVMVASIRGVSGATTTAGVGVPRTPTIGITGADVSVPWNLVTRSSAVERASSQ